MVGFPSQGPSGPAGLAPGRPGPVRPANPGGFTLIELVVAVAMIAILAAMAIPLFSGFLQAQQLRGASEQVRTLLNQARQLAIAQNTSYRVDVNAAGKQLRFCQGTAACTNDSAWKGAGTDANGYIKLGDSDLIEIPSADTVTFNYLGAAAPSGAVMVKRDTTCQNVSVSAAGRIQVASAACP